jgi:anti-anti-sigma regulatory factor
MQITVENIQGNVLLAIMGLHGKLDASNFESVIDKAKEIYAAGVQYLLLDMSELEFMSSSGVVAVHSIALLMRGDEPHNLEHGWGAFRSIHQDMSSGVQTHLKLLNPQSKVALTLEKTGLDNFFEIYTDRQEAIDSF